jgi:hypothetical protein
MSFSGRGNDKSALYVPASAPATTTSFSNFNYPSPSSTSPSSTGAEFLDCSLNTNYVNPADLFNSGSLSTPQSFATPAPTASNSSIIPPTPPFATCLPPVSGPISGSCAHRVSVDSSFFDMDTSDTFSSPQLYEITSPSFTNDSSFQTAQSNTQFQFTWKPTNDSHGCDEYNPSLPFEPSALSMSPTEIITKQSVKFDANNPFSPSALNSAQLFVAFPDGDNVFDLLIDDGTLSYSKNEIVNAMLRGNLVAMAQNGGVETPEIPAAVDLSTYVSAYWEYIHPHIPIFFKPAFVAQFVQEGVLLGVCALGALTVGATHHGLSLNVCAKAIVKEVHSRIKVVAN